MDESEKKGPWRPNVPRLDTPIWRYVDMTQFLSIIEREALWFNRADQFDDPFEGSFTRANVNTRESRYEETEIPVETLETLSSAFRAFRQCAFLSCWHVNHYESAAMWDVYSTKNQGIAIRSTVGRLMRSITGESGRYVSGDTPGNPEKIDRIFAFGLVDYIDYDDYLIPENNLMAPLFYKRKSYQHEREFRVLFDEFTDAGGIDVLSDESHDKAGEYVSVELNHLIEQIHVSPTSPDWFHDLVKRVSDKYDITKNAQKSSLNDDPVF